MIASHTWGDLHDAARIQRKLGRYYADRGDERRSTAAFLAAAAAEQPAKKQADQTLPAQAVPGQPPAPAPPTRPSLTGNYFGSPRARPPASGTPSAALSQFSETNSS
jgi:hypothetical protein